MSNFTTLTPTQDIQNSPSTPNHPLTPTPPAWYRISDGKVRHIYQRGDHNQIALLATDRVSAFDKVLPVIIPDKGRILTAISKFWLERTTQVFPSAWLPNLADDPATRDFFDTHTTRFNDLRDRLNVGPLSAGDTLATPASASDASPTPASASNTSLNASDTHGNLLDRCTFMRKLRMIPVEAIVRGYITGSLWEAYEQGIRATRSIRIPYGPSKIEISTALPYNFYGHTFPEGLEESDRLVSPIFTPTTKASVGEHDQNLTFGEMVHHIEAAGFDHAVSLAHQIRRASLDLYIFAHDFAIERGLILADTKFEFGLDSDGRLLLADEYLTPDSSRYWSLRDYRPGGSQKSFDKQIIRDYLKSHPGVKKLPPEILEKTRLRYLECFSLLQSDSNPTKFLRFRPPA